MSQYTVRATISTPTPEKTAQLFQAVLAVDRGVTSTLTRDGADFIVIADDQQAVRITSQQV